MAVKAIFFDIDNTFYDTTLLAEASRKNAVKAMIESGLDADEDKGYKKLMKIVKQHGPNYDHHYDLLVRQCNAKRNSKIVAAGMVAYHTTKLGYLVPYPEIIHTLLELKRAGYSLGIISNGLPAKQWEKLIHLGLQHFFDIVIISTKTIKKPDQKIFKRALSKVECKPIEAMMVGDDLLNDVSGAAQVGMTTVQVVRGVQKYPKKMKIEPDYIVSNLGSILNILGVAED